jgi:endoglycosylceramidase
VYCGEGAPDWAAALNDSATFNDFPSPFGPPMARDPTTGRPSYADCQKYSWSLYQATFAGSAGYQQVYDSVTSTFVFASCQPACDVCVCLELTANPSGRREEFGLFWKTVAEQFADSDSIIGYELINEPWAGNVWEDLFLFLPWVADQRNLQVVGRGGCVSGGSSDRFVPHLCAAVLRQCGHGFAPR